MNFLRVMPWLVCALMAGCRSLDGVDEGSGAESARSGRRVAAREAGAAAPSSRAAGTEHAAGAETGAGAGDTAAADASSTDAAARAADGGAAGAPASAASSATGGGAEAETVAARPREFGVTETEIAIWNDPTFRKWFAESYAAETDVEPKLTQPEREQLPKALEALGREDLPAAVALLEKLRTPASSATVEFLLATIRFQQDDLAGAVPLYEVAVKKYPKFRRAWRNLGLARVRLAQFPGAIEALTKVIELGGADAVTYGLLAFSYSNTEQHLPAESAYRMANLLDPRTTDWKMGLARSFFKQKRYPDAAALCGALIAETPDRADLWMLQANAFVGMGQPMKAAENFEVVERLGKSTPESLATLGDIYVNQELFEPAAEAYRKAIERNPEGKADRPLRAAKVLAARGATAETKSLLERLEAVYGARLAPEEKKEVLRLKARLAVAAGAGEEEAKVLEEIVALDPLDGEALILLGQHRAKAGDAEKAVFYYERAAGLEAFEADAKVRHAQLLVGQGKYGEAMPLLRRAQTLKPRESIQQYLEQVERAAAGR